MFLLITLLVAGCGSSGSPCPTGQAKCNGQCIDVNQDRTNCGACGTACMAGQYCASGQCKGCENECTLNTKRCAAGSNNQYQTCGDPDNDTCLEWMSPQACANGQICDSGNCKVACTSNCTNTGDKACDSGGQNGYRICGDDNHDGCLEWGALNSCGVGTACTNGECKATCTNECAHSGDLRCTPAPHNDGYDQCADWNSDSCLEWGGHVVCPSGETCSNGTCSSTCTDECQTGQKICDAAGYRTCGQFDTDPCLDWSGITNCRSNEVCDQGDCKLACTNQCQSGAKQCAGNTDYVQCADWNGDQCLEWGGQTSCGANKKCVNGACVDDCQNECPTPGAVTCDTNPANNGYHTCGNYDSDPCLEWSPIFTPCDAGKSCNNGACTSTCTDECQTGQKECFTDPNGQIGWHECGQYDTDTCLDWSPIRPCGTGEICDPQAVRCVSSCTDECTTAAAQKCSGTGYVVCGNWDADPCLEWSSVQSCGTGKKCDSGTNQCVDDCTDQCTQGARQCSGDGYDVCGQWNTDTCLEWGGHTACGSGEVCSNGICASNCTDECAHSGDIVCDGTIGFRMCGNFDADPCLDLSSMTSCAYNQECQAGIGCVVICTEECLPGEARCVAQGAEVCGQFDMDPCLEWSAPTACTPGSQLCYQGKCIPSTPPAKVLVNEILYDDAGIDGEFTFIELWGPGGLSLDNFSVVGVNGNGGGLYNTINLDGYALPADGHFVIATNAADASFRSVVDLFDDHADMQNGPDSIQTRWAGTVVVDALGYGTFGANDTFAGEGTSAADASYDTTNQIMFCLSRGADHADTDNNASDFFKRTTCTPGWEGPGKVLWKAQAYGGTSTPAIDSAGNLYIVDSWGWMNKIDSSGNFVISSIGVQPPTNITYQGSMALSADETRLYVGSNSGLYALNTSDGQPVSGWGPAAAGLSVFSSPAVDASGTIFFGSRGGGVYAVNPDGTQKWNTPTANWVDSSPAIGNIGPANEEYVVVGVGGVGSGQVMALRADTGVAAWANAAGGGCNSSPAIAGDKTVYVGCDDGSLYAFDGATGNAKAGFPVTVAGGTIKLVDGCSPAVAPGSSGSNMIFMTSHSDSTNLYIYSGSTLYASGAMGSGNSSVTISSDGGFLVHSGNILYGYGPFLTFEWYGVLGDTATNWIISSPTISPSGVVYAFEYRGANGIGYLYAIQGISSLYTTQGSFPKFRGNLPNTGRGF